MYCLYTITYKITSLQTRLLKYRFQALENVTRVISGPTVHGQGLSKISRQKNTSTTKNLPFAPDCSRTLANGPVPADNPGCCCISLKTGWVRTGCERGSVKIKQTKPATHHKCPIPLCAPVPSKKFLPVRSIWCQSPAFRPDK